MNSEFDKYLSANYKKQDASKPKRKKVSIKESIADIEWKIAKCTSDINNGNIRNNLLSSDCKKMTEILMHVDAVSKRISQKYNKHKEIISKSSINPTFYTRQLPTESLAVQLESPCMKSVRETCEEISTYFYHEYSKNAGLTDTAGKDSCNEISKDQLWSKTENIMHTFNPNEVSQSMISNIVQSTSNLNILSSGIDLTKDASDLRFKFETGKLKDISTKPALLQTVHQLIEESQVAHFQQFLISEEAKNNAWELEKKLNSINAQINEILQQKYDDVTAKNMRNFYSLQQEHGSLLSSLNCLQSETKRLTKEKEERENAMELLLQKYNRIQSFNKTVHAKQTIIQKLIKNNGGSKSRHQQQQKDIIIAAEKKILKLQNEVLQLSEKYQQLWSEEVEKFMVVPIQNLKSSRIASNTKELVADLSLNRLDPSFNQPGEKQLNTILNKFGIPSYTSPENIIPCIAKIKHELYKSNHDVKFYEHEVESLKQTLSTAKDIHTQLKGGEDEEALSMVPSLKKSKAKSSQIMEECVMFKNSAQTWWEQPAQTTVPWITEDGLNLQQYLDQFLNHADMIRKLQLVTPN